MLVTAAEAVYQADWLRTQCSQEEMEGLRKRLAERQPVCERTANAMSANTGSLGRRFKRVNPGQPGNPITQRATLAPFVDFEHARATIRR